MDIPYGLRVAPDCKHLESDPQEQRVLETILEMIVNDVRLQEIANALNKKSLTMREGGAWTPKDVYQLMPRLVETSPTIFASPEWAGARSTARIWDAGSRTQTPNRTP